jgi:hypothetical protein
MKAHNVEQIRIEGNFLIFTIDGIKHELELSNISKRLANASELERQNYEVSPSGYGIHWPLIDEDLSIDGLLGIKHLPTKNYSSYV